MGIEHPDTPVEDVESLKQQLKNRNEELADCNKALKEEIFKRWRAEEALRESEVENRRLLESFEDGYFEVDLAGNLTFFNESLCRMVGYSHREMMGMNNKQYMTEETARNVYETFNEVFRTGKATKAFDWELLRNDGQIRHVETSVSPVYGPGGEMIGFRGIARDITERWVAERACRASEEKYKEILESIEDGYFEVDIKGNFIFFNESMCKILGYSSRLLKGMNNRQFMSEETSKKVFETFNQVYRTGEPSKALGWELIRKDGEIRFVETSISLMKNSNGEPVGFRGITRDITGIKRLEKAKERAVNHLAHELGTPLSIISAVLDRMPDELRKGNKKKVYEWIERMKRSLRRLSDLKMKIDDILNEKPGQEKERILNLVEAAIAFLDEVKDEPLKEGAEAILQSIIKRLDSLQQVEEFREETIALDDYVHHLCQDALMATNERVLEVVEKLEKGVCVAMDSKVLKKVCDGFLKNAIENTPDEGKIEVELKAEGTLARLDFRDFGVGITPENQKLIFSGFFYTQDTEAYASKKPYLFNAGGAGADLLRARILSEKFGFTLDFSSKRCSYLPSDKDQCPGRISSCPFVKERNACLASGGSIFSLLLPINGP
jgi:PAS domain S-box-containing protein